MSTPATNASPFDRHEPIPGYKTEELLGRGGYGEVWRAIAPGGIAKAIKIVYGNANAANAETEMRALSRIKDVRHPLLLSIERVEVTHGNLVIVTELADRSLADHFARLRQSQSIGVPQEELLKFVSDAGEVLDYLYESYSLQHLDVKPESILIVGGRAKLGDFGLVKNLYERGGSQVGGLTPTYAPPELFEGRPTRQSDQYSLAIVYVHMLTGALPFQAHSTAEIATQHLRGVPDLTALPRPQRPVIARALSKDPSLRFASCTAMVAALKEAAHKSDPFPSAAHSGLPATAIAAPKNAAGRHHPKPVPASDAAAQTCDGCYDTIADLADESAVVDAEDEHSRSSVPTILIGIGGAGVEILGGLVERLHDRIGNSADWPAVEFLVLDSNTRTVSSRFKEADLEHVQVVPLPLKPAEAYGSQASNFVRWLGRRWFYNIPRDLTTGGYRPLGRLALLTNGQRAREGIATVVSRSVNNAAARNGRQAGAQAAPRVILVGAIGGGTGSGAILDVAYAVRGELKRRGLPDEQVHGVLLHAEPRSNAERDKARTNAYATLNELFHFSCPGSHFPGEPLLDAPPFHGDNATFAGTHLLFLGHSQGEAEWKSATDQVAEFLYGIAFTPAAKFLDPEFPQSKDNPGSAGNPRSVDGQFQMRSYQVLSLGASGSPAVADAIRLARNDVIQLWRQGTPVTNETGTSSRNGSPLGNSTSSSPSKSGSSSSTPLGDRTAILNSFSSLSARSEDDLAVTVKQQFTQLSLDLGDFLADAAEVIRLEIGDGAEQFVSKLVDDCLSTTQEQPAGPERTAVILAMIDRYLQADFQEGREEPADDQLFTQLAGRLTVRARGRINSLLDWIRNFVNAADVRIEGARRRGVAAQQLLQALHENALTQAAELHKRVIEIGMTAKNDQIYTSERKGFFGISLRRNKADDKIRECLNSYADTTLNELLHRAVAKVARIVVAEVSTLIEQLDRLSRDLNRMAGSPQHLAPGVQNSLSDSDESLSEESAPELAAYRRLLHEQLWIRRQEIARQIDAAIERKLSNGGQSLRTFLDSEYELQRLLGKPLEDASRQAVLAFIQEINGQLIRACGGDSECPTMRDLAAKITSNLLPEEGQRPPRAVTQVLIVPHEAETAKLRARLGRNSQAATIIEGRQSDITLCSVRRDVTLESAANEIIGGVALYEELANRLHTRVDLTWRPFSRTGSAAEALPQGTQESSGPSHTVVLPCPAGEPALVPTSTVACGEVVPGVF